MSWSHAFSAGYGAYEDGERLTNNPFHPFEEKVQWDEWRDGWWQAEANVKDPISVQSN